LKAMAGRLSWVAAAEIIGVTDRTMRRWRERWQKHGYSGLWDYRKRRPSPKRVPVEQLQEVLQLYREKYSDFNVQHFHEKLREVHGIHFSYTWVKTALQEAGLVRKRNKPGSHRKRRPRRPLPGMMLHPASMPGLATGGGMSSSAFWTTPPARSITPSWCKPNRRGPSWRHCGR
jgi:transposase